MTARCFQALTGFLYATAVSSANRDCRISHRHFLTHSGGDARWRCMSAPPSMAIKEATETAMKFPLDLQGDAPASKAWNRPSLMQMACAALLWACMASAHADSIYKCVDASGQLAFQDIPCAVHAQQRKLDVSPLPTIGNAAEVAAADHRRDAARDRQAAHGTRKKRTSSRRSRAKSAMSWECRAADGEVFYRHNRCPSSIAGDGVVRTAYAEKQSRQNTRARHNAWSRVRVHGTKIPRAEACRRIGSAGAAVRDGHLRDANVSTYDHLMGRDPCGR